MRSQPFFRYIDCAEDARLVVAAAEDVGDSEEDEELVVTTTGVDELTAVLGDVELGDMVELVVVVDGMGDDEVVSVVEGIGWMLNAGSDVVRVAEGARVVVGSTAEDDNTVVLEGVGLSK